KKAGMKTVHVGKGKSFSAEFSSSSFISLMDKHQE
ncbi:hypothetical protein EVA_03315, partial [gut metagenome]